MTFTKLAFITVLAFGPLSVGCSPIKISADDIDYTLLTKSDRIKISLTLQGDKRRICVNNECRETTSQVVDISLTVHNPEPHR